MEIIAIGFGLSLVWHLGKLIFEVLGEILFMRLHDNKYYNMIAGVIKRGTKTKSSDVESVTGMKMGF